MARITVFAFASITRLEDSGLIEAFEKLRNISKKLNENCKRNFQNGKHLHLDARRDLYCIGIADCLSLAFRPIEKWVTQ